MESNDSSKNKKYDLESRQQLFAKDLPDAKNQNNKNDESSDKLGALKSKYLMSKFEKSTNSSKSEQDPTAVSQAHQKLTESIKSEKFGPKTTRITKNWDPTSLICKRMNIPYSKIAIPTSKPNPQLDFDSTLNTDHLVKKFAPDSDKKYTESEQIKNISEEFSKQNEEFPKSTHKISRMVASDFLKSIFE